MHRMSPLNSEHTAKLNSLFQTKLESSRAYPTWASNRCLLWDLKAGRNTGARGARQIQRTFLSPPPLPFSLTAAQCCDQTLTLLAVLAKKHRPVPTGRPCVEQQILSTVLVLSGLWANSSFFLLLSVFVFFPPTERGGQIMLAVVFQDTVDGGQKDRQTKMCGCWWWVYWNVLLSVFLLLHVKCTCTA